MPNSLLISLPRTWRVQSVLSVLLVLSFSGGAQAQNALGEGNALDANTGQGGRVNPTRPSFSAELNFRNAIATGNAPGGLSFRGDLGYRAAGEFSGSLGSDSLFAFRRDSLYSGLAGMGIRGTDALQYQFALTTGSTPPQNLMGNLSVSRSRFASSQQRSANQPANLDLAIGFDSQARELDRRGKQLSAPPASGSTSSMHDSSSLLGTLRSSSTYATTSNLQPMLLSVFAEGVDRQPVGLVASPLLGIAAIPLVQDTDQTNPLVARPGDIGGGANQPGGAGSARLTTSYDGLVEQMRQRVETMRQAADDQSATSTIDPNETNDAWLARQMQELREKLYGQRPANEESPKNADSNNSKSSDAQESEAADPLSPLEQAIEDRQTGINASPVSVELYDPTKMAIHPETLEILRGTAASEIRSLLDPGADTRDLYAEHITIGQRMLSDERYFDAEERFTHALSLRPRDVSAQLGRLHAQIGAGMVLSASVNLQSILSQHPEIIASRYSGNLLPTKERIESLIYRLKERAGIIYPQYSTRMIESDRVRVSSAMVLAYLGYQIQDQQAIEQALEVIRERGSQADRRFASLVEQLWAPSNTESASIDQAEKHSDQD